MSDNASNHDRGGLIGTLSKTYGPFAFGLVAVLVIHQLVFDPQIRVIVEQCVVATQNAREAAEASERTAQLLWARRDRAEAGQ